MAQHDNVLRDVRARLSGPYITGYPERVVVAEISRLEGLNDANLKEIRQLKDRIRNLEAAKNSEAQEVARKRNEVTAQAARISDLKESLQRAKQMAADKDNQVKEMAAKVTEADTWSKDMCQRVLRIHRRLDFDVAVESEHPLQHQVRQALDDVDRKLQDLHAHQANLELTTQQMRESNHALTTELAKSNEELVKKNDDLTAQLKDVNLVDETGVHTTGDSYHLKFNFDLKSLEDAATRTSYPDRELFDMSMAALEKATGNTTTPTDAVPAGDGSDHAGRAVDSSQDIGPPPSYTPSAEQSGGGAAGAAADTAKAITLARKCKPHEWIVCLPKFSDSADRVGVSEKLFCVGEFNKGTTRAENEKNILTLGVIGEFGNGKTFFLRFLTGETDGLGAEGFDMHTLGLNFKYYDSFGSRNGKKAKLGRTLIIDAAGVNAPLPYDGSFKEPIQHTKTMSENIRYSEKQDELYQELTFALSDVVFVVTCHVKRTDVDRVMKAQQASTEQQRKDNTVVIVIHNLRDVTDPQDLCSIWNNDICTVFGGRKSNLSVDDVTGETVEDISAPYMNNVNVAVPSRHYVLVRHTEGWGQRYNNATMDLLREYLRSLEQHDGKSMWEDPKLTTVSDRIGSVLKTKVPFCTGVKLKPLEDNPQEHKEFDVKCDQPDACSDPRFERKTYHTMFAVVPQSTHDKVCTLEEPTGGDTSSDLQGHTDKNEFSIRATRTYFAKVPPKTLEDMGDRPSRLKCLERHRTEGIFAFTETSTRRTTKQRVQKYYVIDIPLWGVNTDIPLNSMEKVGFAVDVRRIGDRKLLELKGYATNETYPFETTQQRKDTFRSGRFDQVFTLPAEVNLDTCAVVQAMSGLTRIYFEVLSDTDVGRDSLEENAGVDDNTKADTNTEVSDADSSDTAVLPDNESNAAS